MDNEIPISALPEILDLCGIEWRSGKEKYESLMKLLKDSNIKFPPVNYKLHKEF